MLSPYRIPSTSHKWKQKIPSANLDGDSTRERDLKRHQMTSNDLKRSQKSKLVKPDTNAEPAVNSTTNKRSKVKDGSVHYIGEIDDEQLDEILHNINLWIELAMQ